MSRFERTPTLRIVRRDPYRSISRPEPAGFSIATQGHEPMPPSRRSIQLAAALAHRSFGRLQYTGERRLMPRGDSVDEHHETSPGSAAPHCPMTIDRRGVRAKTPARPGARSVWWLQHRDLRPGRARSRRGPDRCRLRSGSRRGISASLTAVAISSSTRVARSLGDADGDGKRATVNVVDRPENLAVPPEDRVGIGRKRSNQRHSRRRTLATSPNSRTGGRRSPTSKISSGSAGTWSGQQLCLEDQFDSWKVPKRHPGNQGSSSYVAAPANSIATRPTSPLAIPDGIHGCSPHRGEHCPGLLEVP